MEIIRAETEARVRSYWDREGFILVVKGHTSSVSSLGQHAIKVVFTTSREEPAEDKRQMDMDGSDNKSRNTQRKRKYQFLNIKSITAHFIQYPLAIAALRSFSWTQCVPVSPSELSIHLQSVVHNTIETFDEAVEVLHLLRHVLVALQSLMILPTHGKKLRQTTVHAFKK